MNLSQLIDPIAPIPDEQLIIRGIVTDVTERKSTIRARKDSLLVVIRANVG
jgi:hypothetical protein